MSEERCPLCGGEGRRWREKRGFPILRCAGCENAFVRPSALPADLEQTYSRGYFDGERSTGYPAYLADRDLVAANFEERLDFVESLGPPGKRLLDVGAAYGFFVRAARRRGWAATGIDLAPECAREAPRVAGVEVLEGDFRTADVGGPFDAITMLDVIEHFRDPVACLRRAHALLAPGGLLVVETGDRATPWARLLGNLWYFLDPPAHTFYFSARGIRNVLRSTGFSEARMGRLGRRVSLSNACFKAAAWLPEGRAKRALSRRARRGVPGSVRLDFGDGMIVGARRA